MEREKRVAVVSGGAQRASSAAGAARALGLPQGVGSWSSGEYVHQSLAAKTRVGEEDGDSRDALFPFLQAGKPPRIYELSSVAKPRRWAEYMSRAGPPLAELEKLGRVRRVSGVEEADVCYWDVHEGDEVPWLEAVLELCAEHRVPLLQASRSSATLSLLSASAARGSPEFACASLSRLGGKTFGVGKLQGFARGLGWHGELSGRDVLLVSADIGDVAEAAEHGVDALLLLGDRAQGQLQACRSAMEQEKAVLRKQMSVSQRVAEDSPAMLHLASNPLTAVFRLPGLLAEATRKNAEHRAKQQAVPQAAPAKAEGSAAAPSAKGSPPQAPADAMSQLAFDDYRELLMQWCSAAKVSPPAGLAQPPIRWSDQDSEETVAIPTPVGGAVLRSPPGTSARSRRRGGHGSDVRAGSEENAPAGSPRAPQTESVDDILGLLSKDK